MKRHSPKIGEPILLAGGGKTTVASFDLYQPGAKAGRYDLDTREGAAITATWNGSAWEGIVPKKNLDEQPRKSDGKAGSRPAATAGDRLLIYGIEIGPPVKLWPRPPLCRRCRPRPQLRRVRQPRRKERREPCVGSVQPGLPRRRP